MSIVTAKAALAGSHIIVPYFYEDRRGRLVTVNVDYLDLTSKKKMYEIYGDNARLSVKTNLRNSTL